MAKIQANFRLEESLLQALKDKATKCNIPVTDLVTELLQRGLELDIHIGSQSIDQKAVEENVYQNLSGRIANEINELESRIAERIANDIADSNSELEQRISGLISQRIANEINELESRIAERIAQQENNFNTKEKQSIESELQNNIPSYDPPTEKDESLTDVTNKSFEEGRRIGLIDRFKRSPLQGKYLVIRLNLSNKAILSNKKNDLSPDNFYVWSQEKDIDGIGWISINVHGRSIGYAPHDDTSLEKLLSLYVWIEANVKATSTFIEPLLNYGSGQS